MIQEPEACPVSKCMRAHVCMYFKDAWHIMSCQSDTDTFSGKTSQILILSYPGIPHRKVLIISTTVYVTALYAC